MMPIPIEALTISDIESRPVWQYANFDEIGETAVRPVKRLPVTNLSGKLVATQVKLKNNDRLWGLIGNVDPTNPQFTQHFLTLSVERAGKWFTLARYHDFDRLEKGPKAMAEFLGLNIDDIFPISYDISRFVKGDAAALVGKILEEPLDRLPRAKIIALAVSKPKQ